MILHVQCADALYNMHPMLTEENQHYKGDDIIVQFYACMYSLAHFARAIPGD